MASCSGKSDAAGCDIPTVASHLGLADLDQTLEDILAEHVEYVQKSVDVFCALMENEVFWGAEERHYIGIMAACRHKCSVLVSEQRSRFLECGGPEHWLEGLHNAPYRLQCLHQTNVILAHRPWMFNRAHIQQLVKSGLSLPEVVVAVTIMAYFHAMSSMIHALGIEAVSGDNQSMYPPIPLPLEACGSDSSPRSSELAKGGVAVLLQRMEKISACPDHVAALGSLSSSSSECSEGNLHNISGPELPADPALFDTSADDKYRPFSKYSPNMNFIYKDFYRRGNKSDAQTLKYQHLWEDMGFTTVAKFTSQELADCLDSKFRTASSMTYHTCGNRNNVNTAPFRRAVWNYTQCLFGIRRDDYDYSHVNMLLERHLKVFLKTLSVAPETFPDDLKLLPSILKELKPSEQVHVVILAAEARLQAEMVYAMLAIERYYVCG
ncbi:sestrin-2-like [Hyalella azteca]|uniref:Sestrin-2-like n=1 Tax=Hyalella azteca TaxID=294128 RepID=A0A979FNI8_HYAAZ|nr:sestrin-2-like [Hyalella azteca]